MARLSNAVVYRAMTMLGFPRNKQPPKQSKVIDRIIEQTGWKPIADDLPKKQRKQKEKAILTRYCRMQGLIMDRGMGGRVENAEAGVYVVQQDGGERCFKVGMSTNTAKRVNALKTASPYKLNVVAEIKAQDVQHAKWMEQAVHKRLNKYRLNGEWFAVEAMPIIAKAITESNMKL